MIDPFLEIAILAGYKYEEPESRNFDSTVSSNAGFSNWSFALFHRHWVYSVCCGHFIQCWRTCVAILQSIVSSDTLFELLVTSKNYFSNIYASVASITQIFTNKFKLGMIYCISPAIRCILYRVWWIWQHMNQISNFSENNSVVVAKKLISN